MVFAMVALTTITIVHGMEMIVCIATFLILFWLVMDGKQNAPVVIGHLVFSSLDSYLTLYIASHVYWFYYYRCDGGDYMTEGCDYDGGDCAECLGDPSMIGNGECDPR